jgi:hypothetical protein
LSEDVNKSQIEMITLRDTYYIMQNLVFRLTELSSNCRSSRRRRRRQEPVSQRERLDRPKQLDKLQIYLVSQSKREVSNRSLPYQIVLSGMFKIMGSYNCIQQI